MEKKSQGSWNIVKRIASFCINHDTLTEGMYTSRVDGDVITYDIRMVRPNHGEYLDPPALHTFEHLFATYVRNTAHSADIVYCGPMGCRTGFYYLVRDSMSPETAIALVQQTMRFVCDFTGVIPGSAKAECGNYLSHDLEGAKRIAEKMSRVLAGWTPEQLAYPE